MTMAMPVREGAGNTCRVMLPGGVWQRKSTHPVHEVTLRAACAADDAFILDSAETMMPCERATALIARCLVAADVDASEIAGALTAGDREALLLQLRRLSFGDKIDCVLRCPDRACGELMDLTLGVNDLLLAPYGDVRRHYETHAEVDGRQFDISFRLPVAYDLDDIAAAGHRDPACGATDLLRRCVERIRVNAADIDFDASARAGARGHRRSDGGARSAGRDRARSASVRFARRHSRWCSIPPRFCCRSLKSAPRACCTTCIRWLGTITGAKPKSCACR